MQAPNYSFIRTIVFSLLFSMFLVACDTTKERQEISNIAWQMIDDGALVIDVRSQKEYAKGHLGDAPNIAYENLEELQKLIGTNKSRPVVLYCRSGYRAGVAQTALSELGYTNIYNGLGLSNLEEARSQ